MFKKTFTCPSCQEPWVRRVNGNVTYSICADYLYGVTPTPTVDSSVHAAEKPIGPSYLSVPIRRTIPERGSSEASLTLLPHKRGGGNA